jgi:CDP-paratose 2-epimerase
MRVLVTGGAGFIGGNLAIGLAAGHPDWEITALDNLQRRGSELNLPRLREGGVRFVHGDVRAADDLTAAAPVDAVVECSAEPSVLAGADGSGLDRMVGTNLFGAYACLELCRRHDAQLVFLSTSRVYPVERLRALPLTEAPTRFELDDDGSTPGATARGVSEGLSLDGHRTLYGATKLAAELLIQEYVATFGLRAVVNRCGFFAGPWQMGKVDQGVVAYWMLAHMFQRPLTYIGFGGTGKQVRDLLHVDDLCDLVDRQLSDPGSWTGVVANVGGGPTCSASLVELTELCAEITGNAVEVSATPEDRPGDIPWYVTDSTRMNGLTSWRPSSTLRGILTDVHQWIRENERELRPALAIDGGR